MNFEEALGVVNNVLTTPSDYEYDGIFVKKLEASNTLDAGRTTNQTHIAISGEQMNMFPYLTASGYYDANYNQRDEGLKKYFISRLPMKLFRDNVDRLDVETSKTIFGNSNTIDTHTCVVRSRRKEQADQVQMSITSMDDGSFILFRKALHTKDYLVILKVREKFEYHCFGIKEKDGDVLAELNNKFFKVNTYTRVDIEKSIVTNENLKVNSKRLTGAENVLLYGVPGVGKSHTIQEKFCSDASKIERVVFHPDYTYSDFVGQILPRVDDEGKLKYIFTPGPFTKMLRKAYKDPDNYYYLIVEEINRGNAPAIFGEIFQLLDRKDSDKYPASEIGESEYGISNYDVANIVYEDADHEVRIPSNMYMLATMNTADQNVFTLDTAFQRRWKMKHIKNEVLNADHALKKIEGSDITWGAFASVINDMVVDINSDMVSSEDKRLGAYFVKATELGIDTFPEKVLKYLWDDAFKLHKEAVFDEKEKSLEGIIEKYETAEPDKLKSVLRMNVYQEMLKKTEIVNNINQQGSVEDPGNE